MKAMSRDPSATQKARRAEAKESVISIKPISAPSSKPGAGGFKKGGFKNAFGAANEEVKMEVEENVERVDEEGRKGEGKGGEIKEMEAEESEDDGLKEGERYDPRRPTGCWEGCEGRRGKV